MRRALILMLLATGCNVCLAAEDRIPMAKERGFNECAKLDWIFENEAPTLNMSEIKPGWVRIRIYHLMVRGSVPHPPHLGIAAEIVGVPGEMAVVRSDHDHNGYRWERRVLSRREFGELLEMVLDDSFRSMKRPKPFSFFGNDSFMIQVSTDTKHICVAGDTILYKTEERGLSRFKQVAVAILTAAGFQAEEICWTDPIEVERNIREVREKANQPVQPTPGSVTQRASESTSK